MEKTIFIWLLFALTIIQSLLILALYRGRITTKHTQNLLAAANDELNQAISAKTENLSLTNRQLQEEVARHEITEEMLRETQDYTYSILNSMPSTLIGLTPHGYITHWNSAAQEATQLNVNQALGHHIDDVFPQLPISSELIQQTIANGNAQVLENIQIADTVSSQYFDITIYPLVSNELSGVVIRVDDISLRIRLENMMIQNEKMMSLGELSAGMAHEINNPLSAILQAAQNLSRRSSPELEQNRVTANEVGISLEQLQSYFHQRDLYTFIDNIQEAGERAASIVRNMLEFSRSNQGQHQATDINQLINKCLNLAQRSLAASTLENACLPEISLQLAAQLPAADCNPLEIQQVLLNLISNAVQAVETNADKGIITISSDIDQSHDQTLLKITIEDNGIGMNEETAQHIFEPFYTTKAVGKGTGLGLSVSYFIITERHGGRIEVSSSLNQGSCFTISLPLQI